MTGGVGLSFELTRFIACRADEKRMTLLSAVVQHRETVGGLLKLLSLLGQAV